jgi:hypothetical protein
MNQILKILKDISARKWFGELTIKFNSGKVVLIVKKETIKPNGETENG